MASFAAACRLSARLAGSRLNHAAARGFRTCTSSLAPKNFTMPALSPTMTEGNIATWHVKEGDTFSAGDVLLEIETDKASMDVEAQDDGIMMKIVQGDGSKGVKVGTRIGVVAEPGDDISQLEMPTDNQATSSDSGKAETSSAQPARHEEAASQKKAADTSSAQKKVPKQKYPLYPSVEHLFKEHKLDESAIGEMTPTGPQGRLLKGDVLAYLGRVASDRPAQISTRFEHNSHLDLSNIKIAKAPEARLAKKDVKREAAATLPVSAHREISFALVMEVQRKIESSLGTLVPLSTFIARAVDVANDDLPLPKNQKPSVDDLFNQLLGLDPLSARVSRGKYVPQVSAISLPSSLPGVAPKAKTAKVDIIDLLSGRAAALKPCKPSAPAVSSGINRVSLTVPPPEAQRANIFLDRVKNILEKEPGRLVL